MSNEKSGNGPSLNVVGLAMVVITFLGIEREHQDRETQRQADRNRLTTELSAQYSPELTLIPITVERCSNCGGHVNRSGQPTEDGAKLSYRCHFQIRNAGNSAAHDVILRLTNIPSSNIEMFHSNVVELLDVGAVGIAVCDFQIPEGIEVDQSIVLELSYRCVRGTTHSRFRTIHLRKMASEHGVVLEHRVKASDGAWIDPVAVEFAEPDISIGTRATRTPTLAPPEPQ